MSDIKKGFNKQNRKDLNNADAHLSVAIGSIHGMNDRDALESLRIAVRILDRVIKDVESGEDNHGRQ